MYNAVKCKSAVEESMRESPPGKFRKKLIDFGAWKKHYGVRTAYVQREDEQAFTISTYLAHAEHVLGIPKAVAAVKWKAYVDDPNIEREGPEQDPELWICTAKTRSKEKMRYHLGGCVCC